MCEAAHWPSIKLTNSLPQVQQFVEYPQGRGAISTQITFVCIIEKGDIGKNPHKAMLKEATTYVT